jgi:CRP-like cAMP-binding protein
MAQTAARGVLVLDEDPELAAGLDPAELEEARRALIVPRVTREPGSWDPAQDAPEPSLGLLVLDGLVTVNVVLGDRVASQLVGPGDILHPARALDVLLPAALTHHVSELATLAVLDRRFIAGTRRWPALLLALHERMRQQERRLAVLAAIGKLRRVEDRVVALLWHLAERWGRIGASGVIVPLALTHETIGRLAGAERPTVSLALAQLARDGTVVRREDGSFRLRPGSNTELAPDLPAVPQVRPLAVELTADRPRLQDGEAGPLRAGEIDRLRQRVAALRADLPERRRAVEELVATARERSTRSSALRGRLAEERRRRSGGG